MTKISARFASIAAIAWLVITPAAFAVSAAETQLANAGQGVVKYPIGNHATGNFVDVTGQIPAMGGTVLSGNPQIKIRFDAPPAGGMSHGVFEQTGGASKIRIVFPFDEHIQVIEGLVKITDIHGKEFYLGQGDSYFIDQGTVVLWEVLTPVFQKSFFNYAHPAH